MSRVADVDEFLPEALCEVAESACALKASVGAGGTVRGRENPAWLTPGVSLSGGREPLTLSFSGRAR